MNHWRHIAEKWNRFDEAIAQSKWLLWCALGLGLALFVAGDFLQTLFLLPENVHFIRQTDSWAFSAHYHQFHNSLFQPAVYNLASHEARAACEFPLLYWCYGKLYGIFQFSPVVPRAVSAVLNFIATCALFSVLASSGKSAWNALIATSLACGSALFLFYAPNFLPDSLALAFTLLAFAHSLKHANSKPWTVWAAILFAMAGLLKPTFLIYPLAWCLHLVFARSEKFLVHRVWPLLAIALPAVAWNIYAVQYNEANGDTYFMMHSAPIWSMTMSEVANTWDHITRYWITTLFHPSGLHFCAVALLSAVVIALVQKRKPPVLESALLAGSLAFVVLFFEKLKDHDYYFLTLLPSFLLLMHCAMQVWHSSRLPLWSKSLVQVAMLAMTIVSIHYGYQRAMKRFYHQEKTSQEIVMQWLGADEQMMISRSTTEADTLWIQGDASPNAGLMLLGRKGFTDFNLPVHSIESTKPKFIITPLYLADRIGFSDSLYSPVGFSNQAILFERK